MSFSYRNGQKWMAWNLRRNLRILGYGPVKRAWSLYIVRLYLKDERVIIPELLGYLHLYLTGACGEVGVDLLMQGCSDRPLVANLRASEWVPLADLFKDPIEPYCRDLWTSGTIWIHQGLDLEDWP